jgi:hypothetical protein
MAKRRRSGPGRKTDRTSGTRQEREGGAVEGTALSNQQVQAQLGAMRTGPAAVDLDTVRRAAFPLVERAILALQTLPVDAERVNRFVDILSRSHLPEDRKQELVDRLLNDQAAAGAIHSAMERVFGADDEAVRSQLVGLLDDVWSGLQHGRADGMDWRLEDGRRLDLPEGAHRGAVGGRAEELVGRLSEELAPAGVRERLGEAPVDRAVRTFCRDVYLAVRLSREEEEEEQEGVEGPWPSVEQD